MTVAERANLPQSLVERAAADYPRELAPELYQPEPAWDRPTPPSGPMTLEEFVTWPDHGLFELVDGTPTERHMSNLAAQVSGNLYFRLRSFAEPRQLGVVFNSEVLYRCFPHRPGVGRKPDVSFIRANRATPTVLGSLIYSIAPDLAVEVLSPGDLAEELEVKVADYFSAGVQQVWVLSPAARTARLMWADGRASWRQAAQTLDGGELLVGWSVELTKLFALPPLGPMPTGPAPSSA